MAKLVPVQDLQPAFSNAMDHLCKKLVHDRPGELRSVNNMVRAFKEEFDCYLLFDQNWNWEQVGFKDEEHQLMFVLKWS